MTVGCPHNAGKTNVLSVLEMDSAEFSSLTSNLNAARQFRAATVEYVRRSLIGDESLESPVPKTSSIVTSFKPIAEAISRFCSPGELLQQNYIL